MEIESLANIADLTLSCGIGTGRIEKVQIEGGQVPVGQEAGLIALCWRGTMNDINEPLEHMMCNGQFSHASSAYRDESIELLQDEGHVHPVVRGVLHLLTADVYDPQTRSPIRRTSESGVLVAGARRRG